MLPVSSPADRHRTVSTSYSDGRSPPGPSYGDRRTGAGRDFYEPHSASPSTSRSADLRNVPLQYDERRRSIGDTGMDDSDRRGMTAASRGGVRKLPMPYDDRSQDRQDWPHRYEDENMSGLELILQKYLYNV